MKNNKLLNALSSATNVTQTQNGAKTRKTSNSSLLDFYAQGGALRNASESDIETRFDKAFGEDALLALKTLFYLRDIRGGQGERRTFRVGLKWLAKNHTKFAKANLSIIPLYGRWDDILFAFDETPLEQDALNLFSEQLLKDFEEKDDTKLSLAGKWACSINTSSERSRKIGRKIAKAMDLTEKNYRKLLSELRARLNVVEPKLCRGEWGDINYSALPSRAHLKYRKSFYNRDEERYKAFIEDVASGEKKINAGALYPYDLVSKARRGDSGKELEVLWDNLPDFFGGEPHNGIVVTDVSGSMNCPVGGSNSLTAMDVSISLGLYMAEKCEGPFKDHFITFSDRPELQKVKGSTFSSKVKNLESSAWGYNTNIQAVFNLILKEAKKNKLEQTDLPEVVYVVSDMQFDRACSCNSITNFESIRDKFKLLGYEMPRLVFWNVDAKGTDSPVTTDDTGALLASGCSPVIFQHVIENSTMSAYDMFLQVVEQDRYKFVTLPN